jgi:hypothetical protein
MGGGSYTIPVSCGLNGNAVTFSTLHYVIKYEQLGIFTKLQRCNNILLLGQIILK